MTLDGITKSYCWRILHSDREKRTLFTYLSHRIFKMKETALKPSIRSAIDLQNNCNKCGNKVEKRVVRGTMENIKIKVRNYMIYEGRELGGYNERAKSVCSLN